MILKYKHKDDKVNSVTEIIDLTMDDGRAVFTPKGANFYDIVITGLTETQYELIINDLYRNGKADVTSYSADTDYDCNDKEVDEYED